MKLAALTLLGLLGTNLAYAAEFAAPPFITTIVTSERKAETPFYRALVKDTRSMEGQTLLIVEKMTVDSDAPQLVWQRIFGIRDFGKVPQTAFEALEFEPSLGCCNYNELTWKNNILYFMLVISEKERFRCTIAAQPDAVPVCRR